MQAKSSKLERGAATPCQPSPQPPQLQSRFTVNTSLDLLNLSAQAGTLPTKVPSSISRIFTTSNPAGLLAPFNGKSIAMFGMEAIQAAEVGTLQHIVQALHVFDEGLLPIPGDRTPTALCRK